MSFLTSNGDATISQRPSYASPENSWGYSAVQTIPPGGDLEGSGVLTTHRDVIIAGKIVGGPATVFVEFSVNGGIDYDSSFSYVIPINGGIYRSIQKNTRTCRVRIVDGGNGVEAIRFQTEFREARAPSSPLNGTIDSGADSSVVRSVSSELDIAFGRFDGIYEDTKFGWTGFHDAADPSADVWPLSRDDYVNKLSQKTFPDSAAELFVATTAEADANLQFTAEVIDENGLFSEVTFTTHATDGRIGTSLGVSGLDVNRVELTGDDQNNTGDVFVTQGNDFAGTGIPNTLADTVAFIEANEGQTQQAMRRVPLDRRTRIKGIIITIARASGAAGSAIIKLRVKKPGGSWVTKRRWNLPTGEVIKRAAGLVFDGGTLIKGVVDSVSDQDTHVTFEFVYEDIEIAA
jgi:hypothetical protein